MKRIAAIFLTVTLVLALSACGKKEDPYAGISNPVATITLSDGRQMRFELKPAEAPNTVANFIELANSGFYDGLEIFRVVAGVLIQSGDPNNDGTGDPGYAIAGEFSENGFVNNLSHARGTISMCRQSDYNSAGSQFFILQGSYPEYDGQYAAFGRDVYKRQPVKRWISMRLWLTAWVCIRSSGNWRTSLCAIWTPKVTMNWCAWWA